MMLGGDAPTRCMRKLHKERDAARAEVTRLQQSHLTPEELAALEDAVDCFEGEIHGRTMRNVAIAGDALDKLRKARGK
jgi:hypothetical protein